MGQGWSQEYSSTDIYTSAGATTSAGLGPKTRADSEPPTSIYGGTQLNLNIPEDEELKTTPSELAKLTPPPIASADWKKAAADSGILKEKSATLAAFLESKPSHSSTFSDGSFLEVKEALGPPKPRERSQSVGGFAHFADFSLFPDKFGSAPYKNRHVSGSSNLSDEEKSVPTTPPPTPNLITPLQSVKDAFFRNR